MITARTADEYSQQLFDLALRVRVALSQAPEPFFLRRVVGKHRREGDNRFLLCPGAWIPGAISDQRDGPDGARAGRSAHHGVDWRADVEDVEYCGVVVV